MRALALMPLLWAVAWLGIDATGYWLEATAAFVSVTFFVIIFGIGECFHGPAHQALVGELGSDRLRGRYFALHSMSWGLGGTVGPGGRRVHPRRGAVRALAARRRRLRRRVGRRARARAARAAAAATDPSRRARARPRPRRARAGARRSRRTGRRVEFPRYDRASGRSAQYRCPACLASGARGRAGIADDRRAAARR